MIDKNKIAVIIIRKLAELEAHQNELTESTATVQLDQSRVGRLSRMDALQIQAMQVETMRRVKLQLVQLKKAQQRLDSGDFDYAMSVIRRLPVPG